MRILRFFLFFFLVISPFFTSCTQAARVETSILTTPVKPRRGKGRLIVLDPGHGGFDIGANVQAVREKMVALQTALLAKKHLSSMGYRVILTRSRDIFIPLERRAAIANDTKSKLFVSVHYNACKDKRAKGIEVYFYQKRSNWRASCSKKLAESVLSRLLVRTRAPSRGVKKGNFHVIRETKMPAILVEGGFITHPKEREQLKKRKYLDQIAWGIAEGVDHYFHK